MNIQTIFENTLKDPTVMSNINIDELLKTLENDKHDYLENKTTDIITSEIYNKIKELNFSIEKQDEFCNKLIGYRFIDELRELHKGKQIRWISMKNQNLLTNGGIVVNIKFLDNGTYIVCKNAANKFMQFNFDDCIIFQKMSTEEQLILLAYDYISK
jgi:hypothetical protein